MLLSLLFQIIKNFRLFRFIKLYLKKTDEITFEANYKNKYTVKVFNDQVNVIRIYRRNQAEKNTNSVGYKYYFRRFNYEADTMLQLDKNAIYVKYNKIGIIGTF